jgi:hypothetical protein
LLAQRKVYNNKPSFSEPYLLLPTFITQNPSTRSFPKNQSFSEKKSLLPPKICRSTPLSTELHHRLAQSAFSSPTTAHFYQLLYQASPLQPSFLQIINSAAPIKKVDGGINFKILITDPSIAEKSGTSFRVIVA